MQPFANTLVTLTLTGAQIKTVLEQQWQPAGATRPFLKLGVTKELDLHLRPDGAARARTSREILLNGVPIDPDRRLHASASNSFLASGGDNFFDLAKGTNKADSGKVDLQAMVDYFAADADHTVSPDIAQRAVGVRVSAPDADGYDAGDRSPSNLSSLDFSRDEPAAGTVTISSARRLLGSAPVTRAYTVNFDEIGTRRPCSSRSRPESPA